MREGLQLPNPVITHAGRQKSIFKLLTVTTFIYLVTQTIG